MKPTIPSYPCWVWYHIEGYPDYPRLALSYDWYKHAIDIQINERIRQYVDPSQVTPLTEEELSQYPELQI